MTLTPLSDPAAVDEYLAKVSEPGRGALAAIRDVIRGAAPASVERLTYNMPYYFHHGPLVGFAARGGSCTLYIGGTSTLPAHSSELEGWDVGKGCIRFSPLRPPPASLVAKLVRARVAENEAAATPDRQAHEPPRRGVKR